MSMIPYTKLRYYHKDHKICDCHAIFIFIFGLEFLPIFLQDGPKAFITCTSFSFFFFFHFFVGCGQNQQLCVPENWSSSRKKRKI